ncbi:hypothetical protein FA95DRAFT_1419239 [Auriscalpium vulgare]|uniref:Uncharacterized protein n=1 Tax=Auriscalpium vulgare TaxID=40419 RepID=A0ACB8RPM5_9AGAM|nr:hypothetical protein FA95DRAFT_1419239 [Auriscalpium vulgare]
MVAFTSLFGAAAVLASVVSASPMPDNNLGEVAVSAPNGTPLSDSPTSTATSSYGSQTSNNYGGSSYDSGSSYNSGSNYDSSSYDSSYGSNYGSNSYDSSSKDNSWSSTSKYDDKSYNTYDNSYSSSSTYSSYSPSYTSSSSSYGSSSYGSGSSSWGGSGYDSCVQQCVASFGSPSSAYIATSTASSEGSYGTGATHTVWVAPTQGVLRMVPFATNASVGDTVKFIWGGNDHTVTKSSQLEICNKTSDAPFASGTQNLSFVFTQVVNDTNPTFYYCGTPTHCQKGMFGIINPPNALGAASAAIPGLAANSSSTSAALSYANNATSNNAAASSWGANIDLSTLPTWAHSLAAENILYTRAFLGQNPEVINTDGTVDMSAAANNALMIPSDVASLSNNAAVTPASSSAASDNAASSAAPAASSAAASPVSAANKPNGAGVMASPSVAVALVAVVAAFFAL